MIISYDSSILDKDKIISCIVNEGYEANLAENGNPEKKKVISLKTRLIISIIFEIPLFLSTMGGINLFIPPFIFLIPIVLVNYNYFVSGLRGLLNKSPNMDSLVCLGAIASICYGYFESAGTIITLITLGKYFEDRSKDKTKESRA